MQATVRDSDTAEPTNAVHRIDAKVVAFDVDNTLVDILATKRRAIDATAEKLLDEGLDTDLGPEQLADRLYAHALDVGIDAPDVVPSFLADELGVEDERTAAFGQRTLERLEPGMVRLYASAVETIDALRERGYRVYAVTDAPRECARRRLDSAGLSGRFDEILVREDTPNGKADSRPFELVLDDAGIDADELVAVGDHPVRDVSNVVAIGGHGVLATHGAISAYNRVEAPHEPTARIDGLDELLDLLPGPSEAVALAENPFR